MNPVCPKCGGSHCIRIKREGFFQTHILPRLDRYPWECTDCRSNFTSKHRGKRRRRSGHESADSPTHPIPLA